MKLILTTLLLAASLGYAQDVGTPPNTMPVTIPNQPTYPELAGTLGLSDAQLQQLVQLQTQHFQANQGIYTQMSEKENILSAQISSDNPDPAIAGAAVVAISNLRRQLNNTDTQYRGAALAILTPDQRPKLQGLEDARKLQTPIWQAQSLGLLDYNYALLAASGQPAAASGIGSVAIPAISAGSGRAGIASTLIFPGKH